MKKGVLLQFAVLGVVYFLGKYVFDFCTLNHIDLVRPMFLGLFITCIMAVVTMKNVFPAAMGAGVAFSDVIFQVITVFRYGSSK